MSDTRFIVITGPEREFIDAALSAFKRPADAGYEHVKAICDKLDRAAEYSSHGWTNVETWTANLWLANEERTSNHARGICNPLMGRTHHENGRILRGYIEEEISRMTRASRRAANMIDDMLGAALDRVNWSEIAEHFAEQ